MGTKMWIAPQKGNADPEGTLRKGTVENRTEQEYQGYHGGCGTNCRCCLPALAGFVSPHSMGPGAAIKPKRSGSIKEYPIAGTGKISALH